MADLTILTPQPFFSHALPSTTGLSARHSDYAGRGPISNCPASSVGPSSSDVQSYDPNLLSPPLHLYRARRKTRRAREREEQTSATDEGTSQSEDEEFTIDASEGRDSEPEQFLVPSYTESFHPFAYPSAPSVTQVSAYSKGDLPRPAPPLCKS